MTVDAVKRRVLRDEQDLFHAAGRERTRLADDRIGWAAPVVAAQRRDDAEGALVIASLGDLHVGVVFGGCEKTRRVGVVDI